MADVTSLYMRLRERARQIVSRLPPPDFYRDEIAAVSLSESLFESTPLVAELRQSIAAHLEDDFGHGWLHARKVAVDAGALMYVEGRAAGYSEEFLRRRICLVHCAGLLHDIRRKRPDHAEQGAACARGLISGPAFSPAEIEDICIAIRNHEAFKTALSVDTQPGALMSDCLYDADKFRWGPDNFSDTLWAMAAFARPPLSEFLRRYPSGMERLARIKTSFRTATGRKYGPQFIDLGIAIGEELYRAITAEFAAEI
jgi:hypothetical protein